MCGRAYAAGLLVWYEFVLGGKCFEFSLIVDTALFFQNQFSFKAHTTTTCSICSNLSSSSSKKSSKKGDEKYYLWNFSSWMFGIFHATTEATFDFGLFIGWSSCGTYWPSLDH